MPAPTPRAAKATALAGLLLSFALALPASAQAPSTYGAIAYSPRGEQWGWANAYLSQADAERRAMQECRSRAGQHGDCRVAIWFRNACGALALGPQGWGSGWGSTQHRANQEALGVCSRHSGACRVQLEVCSR